MDIGLGLPTTVAGADRSSIVSWARAAEYRGFSSLGVLDRIVYPNLDALTSLAAAAAVTETIRLTTSVLIAPARQQATLVKQIATLDLIAGPGRVVLGLASGGREDDFIAAGVDYHRRGKLFDDQLAAFQTAWSGPQEPPVGPSPATPSGPSILVGGASPAAVRRSCGAAGWIAGGGGVAGFSAGAERVRAAWREAGRESRPYLAGIAYVSLGVDAVGDARRVLGRYYAFVGARADRISEHALTTPDQVKAAVSDFESAGCDELILFPCATDLSEIDRVAAAAGI